MQDEGPHSRSSPLTLVNVMPVAEVAEERIVAVLV